MEPEDFDYLEPEDLWDEDEPDPADYDAELAADQILERQELEDFEDADDRYGDFEDVFEPYEPEW